MEFGAIILAVIVIMVVASRFERRGHIVTRDENVMKNDTNSPMLSDRFMVGNINHDED